MKKGLKKQINELSLEEAITTLNTVKHRISDLEKASVDMEKLTKIANKAIAFLKINSGRKFNSDIIVSLFGKEHVFALSLKVTNIFFDGDEYDMEYTIKSKKKSFLDREIEMNLSAAMDEGLYCDDFRNILIKEVPEFSKMIKELDAIIVEILALSDREQEIVMNKILE